MKYGIVFFWLSSMALLNACIDAIDRPDYLINDDRILLLDGDICYLNYPPVSVDLHDLTDDDCIFLFVEKTEHVLSTDIHLDIATPGNYFDDSVDEADRTWATLHPQKLKAGTLVNSYYLHYDNASYDADFDVSDYLGCEGQISVSGRIQFKDPILGIIMRAGVAKRDHLGRTNTEFGFQHTLYCEHNLSHFPGINIVDGCGSDRFVISDDRYTLTFKNNTDIHHDNYRVITLAE